MPYECKKSRMLSGKKANDMQQHPTSKKAVTIQL